MAISGHSFSWRAASATSALTLACGLAAFQWAPAARAQAQAPGDNTAVETLPITKSQHRRITFTRDITRIAVGDTEIASAELLTGREVLALGRQTGTTSLIVWYADGTTSDYVLVVGRDLSLLRDALARISRTIQVESAPDRDAIVLLGRVPTLADRNAAEKIVSDYLESGNRQGDTVTASDTPQDAAAAASGGAGATQPRVLTMGPPRTSGRVINLLQVDNLPPSAERRIEAEAGVLGAAGVRVRRIVSGPLADDAKDTLVLEGRVANQVMLIRVLTLATRIFTGTSLGLQDIRVLADEGGALAGQQQSQQTSQLGGGGTSSLLGGSRGSRLTNQVGTNLARAKAVEAAGGRILSFVEVTDLPQVRVDIRLVEVNRSKLRAFDPNAAILGSTFRQPSLNPAQSATTVQGNQAARIGSTGGAIQNVLSFLNGGLLNQFQYSGGGAAIDDALSLLEREGIAQSLSSPSLTVLSGESAQVQIGGEVPIPTAFAPAFGASSGSTSTGGTGATGAGGTSPGVFSAVEFVPFGVQLQVRPLVGDDDTITLDLQPSVVTPDSVLTNSIRQSTGASVPTTAFQTRALRTTSRLQDGQALLIGGLVSSTTSSNVGSTPGLRAIPLLGRLFESTNRNDATTELVIVVHPVVVRTANPRAALWAFPDRSELLRSLAGSTGSVVQP